MADLEGGMLMRWMVWAIYMQLAAVLLVMVRMLLRDLTWSLDLSPVQLLALGGLIGLVWWQVANGGLARLGRWVDSTGDPAPSGTTGSKRPRTDQGRVPPNVNHPPRPTPPPWISAIHQRERIRATEANANHQLAELADLDAATRARENAARRAYGRPELPEPPPPPGPPQPELWELFTREQLEDAGCEYDELRGDMVTVARLVQCPPAVERQLRAQAAKRSAELDRQIREQAARRPLRPVPGTSEELLPSTPDLGYQFVPIGEAIRRKIQAALEVSEVHAFVAEQARLMGEHQTAQEELRRADAALYEMWGHTISHQALTNVRAQNLSLPSWQREGRSDPRARPPRDDLMPGMLGTFER